MGFWNDLFGGGAATSNMVEEPKKNTPDEEYLRFLEQVKEMFSENSLGDIVSFLKDLKGLLPIISSNERLNGGLYDLKNVIGVVYSLMYGIPVEQYMAANVRYEDAEGSILKLASRVNEDVIVKLRDAKRDLTEEVEALKTKNEELKEENASRLRTQQSLEEKIEELSGQRDEIERGVGKLKEKLRQLEESGKQEAEAHIEERKQQLNKELEEHRKQVEKDKKSATSSISTEVATLEERKQTLKNAINELETALANFDKRIASLSSPQVEDDGKVTVRWVPVKSDHPIYSVSYDNINDYYESVLNEYCDRVGCNMSKARQEFNINCPGLSQLIATMEEFYNMDKLISYTTIGEILSHNDYYSHKNVSIIVKRLNLPVYEKTKGKTTNSIIPVASTPPANVQTLLQVLELQKQLIKAKADVRINQMYVNTLIQILSSVTPPDMDLSNLLLTYGLSSDALQMLTSSEESKPEGPIR